MKKSSLAYFILSICFILNSYADENKIQLKLKEGQEIEFEYIYNRHSQNLPFINEINFKWIFKAAITKKISEGKFIILVNPQRYISTDYGNKRPDIHFDSMYPPAADEYEPMMFPTVFYETLCNLQLKIGLDIHKNELILLENESLTAEVERLLRKSGLKSSEIKTTVKEISSELEQIRKIIDDYLLHFNNASITSKDLTRLDKKDFFINRIKDNIKLTKQETIAKDDKTEVHSFHATINPQDGLLKESVSKISWLSSKNKNEQLSELRSEEKTFILTRNSETWTNQVTIDGYVDTPVSKEVQLGVLKAPCGTDKEVYKVKLDSTNRFSATISLSRENMIFIMNEDESRRRWITWSGAIYAEPGDHMKIELFGKGDSITIKCQGDHVAENELLNLQFHNKAIIFNGVNGKTIPISYGGKKFHKMYSDYFKLINSSDTIPGKLISEISERGRIFLENEEKMQRLLSACHMMDLLYLIEGLDENNELLQEYYKIQQFINNFKISKHFQEQGYFSRIAVRSYFHTLFRQNLKYANPLSPVNNYSKNYIRYQANQDNVFQQINYMESILAGSALVHGKIIRIQNNLASGRQHNKYDRDTWFEIQKQIGDEIISSSKNNELNFFLQNELNKAEDLYSEKIYSKRIFLTPEGDSVSINDYRGKKTCVISITYDWGTNRYLFDDLSKKYPDINAIIINQGDDFEKWKDYLKRAEPKAIQLFLSKGNLEKLFFTYNTYNNTIVFDKLGKLLDYEADINMIESYIKKAQNPEPEKKEINKSALKLIILILTGVLILFLIFFFFYKVRIKRRLKKQHQEKRLRELQMAAIRAQMNPHFLFNSLNSVQNLIQQNRASEAHLYLSDFAGLIRKVLKNSQREEISLAEELETLNQYIQLEKLRFNFRYELHVDEGIDSNNFMVPSMILQPVVENSIIHGLQHKTDNKKLFISVLKSKNSVLITIEDNGIGLKAAKKFKSVSNGIGLKMNEERLKIMNEKYKDKYSFQIIDLFKQGEEGTRVEITIPEEM